MLEINDYIDVKQKASELDCNTPTGLALLPINFAEASSKSELLHEGTASTIRSLWRQEGITETTLESENEQYPIFVKKAFVEWVAPTVFIATSLWSQNPVAVTVALNVISTYAAEFLHSFPSSSSKKVKLSVVVERPDGHNKRVNYEGDVSGLKDVPQIVREVYKGER